MTVLSRQSFGPWSSKQLPCLPAGERPAHLTARELECPTHSAARRLRQGPAVARMRSPPCRPGSCLRTGPRALQRPPSQLRLCLVTTHAHKHVRIHTHVYILSVPTCVSVDVTDACYLPQWASQRLKKVCCEVLLFHIQSQSLENTSL